MIVYFNVPTTIVLCLIAFAIGIYVGAKLFGRKKEPVIE